MTYAYIPVTITNSESTATPTDFQQLVTVDLSYYSAFLNQDLSNTFFSSDTAGSTVVTSWLESGNTYPFSSVNFWLYLPDGIGASSSITVYLQVDLTNTSHFNTTTTGVAPQLTSTYAEYDNASTIFNFYDNFIGTTLSSKWVTGASGGTYTVDNGLSLSIPATSGDYVYVASASAIASQPIITESYMNGNSLNLSGVRTGFGLVPSQTYLIASGTSQDHVSWQGSELAVTEIVSSVQTGTSYVNPTSVNPVDGNYHLWGIEWLSGEAGFWYNGYSPTTTTSDVPTDTTYVTLSYYANALPSSTPPSILYQWVRTRLYPPSGVMPSASAGIPSGFPYYNTTTYEDLL